MFEIFKKKYLFAVTANIFWKNEYEDGPDERASSKEIVQATTKENAIKEVLKNVFKEYDNKFYKIEILCVPAIHLFTNEG